MTRARVRESMVWMVAAVIERYGEVGLIYLDGGQDLMIPVDHPQPW